MAKWPQQGATDDNDYIRSSQRGAAVPTAELLPGRLQTFGAIAAARLRRWLRDRPTAEGRLFGGRDFFRRAESVARCKHQAVHWGTGMSETDLTTDDRESRRLFQLAFAAIVATSFGFVLRAFVIDDWGREFALSETQKGEILGAGLWPFAISIALLSFVIDRVGFRVVFLFALTCHVLATVLTLSARATDRSTQQRSSSALGNGAVEIAANPLVATLFPPRTDTLAPARCTQAGPVVSCSAGCSRSRSAQTSTGGTRSRSYRAADPRLRVVAARPLVPCQTSASQPVCRSAACSRKRVSSAP